MAYTRQTMAKSAAVALVFVWGISAPRPSAASEVRVQTRTYGEAYTLRLTGLDRATVPRRRLVQYVNLGVYDLLPPTDASTLQRDPEDGQLRIVTSLRLRHDFGAYLQDAEQDAQRLVNAIDGRQVDVMYAFVEGTRLAGWLDARVGRQFSRTGLDFYSFDGGWVRARTPAHLGVAVSSGVMVRGADVLGAPNFELDGTDTSVRRRAVAPVVGAEVSLLEVPGWIAAVAWRQTFETAPNSAEQAEFDLPDGHVVLESLLSARLAWRGPGGRLAVDSSIRYDFGVSAVTDGRIETRARLTDMHAASLSYQHTTPIFSLDSIFNVFDLSVVELGSATWDVTLAPRWQISSHGLVRIFRARAGSTRSSWGAPVEATSQGGGVTVAYNGRVRGVVDGRAVTGEGGTRVSGFADLASSLLWNRLVLQGRFYGNYVDGEDRPWGQGWNAAVQGIARGNLWEGISLSWLVEPGTGSQWRWSFRTMLLLSMDWQVRGGSRR